MTIAMFMTVTINMNIYPASRPANRIAIRIGTRRWFTDTPIIPTSTIGIGTSRDQGITALD